MKINTDAKRYYRDFKTFLPIYGKKELHLYHDIKIRLKEIIHTNLKLHMKSYVKN